VTYFGFFQSFGAEGFAIPFEVGINIIYMIMLFMESIFAYIAAKDFVHNQEILFRLEIKRNREKNGA